MDRRALIDSLHPLEAKVLTALAREVQQAQSLEALAAATQLEPSQVSMAVEWLLAKKLIRVESELVTSQVSLTKIGEQYLQGRAPIERALATLRTASDLGQSYTIQELQAKEQIDPTQMSGVVGTLKKEGAIRIVQGGYVQATGRSSSTAETLRGLLEQLKGGPTDLAAIAEPAQAVLKQYAIRRGNTQEPFRIDDRVTREYALTDEGLEAAQALAQVGEIEDAVVNLKSQKVDFVLLSHDPGVTKAEKEYAVPLAAFKFPAATADGGDSKQRVVLAMNEDKIKGMKPFEKADKKRINEPNFMQRFETKN